MIDVLQKLWEVFVEEEATLVEVNPLVKTPDGRIVALDGKVTLDGNAEFRHEDVFTRYADVVADDDLEGRAKAKDLNYVKLDGQVGIIGNGAGLVMSTLDVVAYAGEKHGGVKPANFLDIGGGASAQVMADGLEIILSDPDVRSVFVNVFGGITSCDAVADGIVQALGMLGDAATKPLVVRLDGNNVEEGRAHPRRGGNHPLVTVVDTMDGAADKAAELALKGALRNGHLPDRRLQGHRPGHHRLRGHQAHPSHGRLRHQRRRWRQPARRPAATSTASRSSPPSPRRWRRPAPTCRCIFVPPAFAKAAVIEAIDASIGAGRRHHRGHPGAGLRLVLAVRRRASRPGSSGRTAPA